jgi:hypothetical protein
MFVRTKIIDGKKRRYLVESYRNDQGKVRQRHITYVDKWPETDIEKIKDLYKQYKTALANSISDQHAKAFKQEAANEASKLWTSIRKFEHAMDSKVWADRARADGRRLDSGTGKRRHQFRRISGRFRQSKVVPK